VIEGRYDRQITDWAKSVPRSGVFATSFHEPEDNLSAEEFVAYQRHVYPLVKSANPTIRWGPVYNAYWWDPDKPDHYIGDAARWWPGGQYADFAALDWYGADPEPMTTSKSFRHWYRFMARTGKPLYIPEYGQYVLAPGETSQPHLEQERAAAIRKDAEWIAGHRQVAMWIYWQGVGPRGDWQMHDPASEQAWRHVTELGCEP
jgi:beta-mannanase